jgi:hypothetical protein
MKDTSTILQFLARLSYLYEERFLKPLWNKYSNRESDDWDALIIFLEGYAFARQGAPNDFIHAACDAIQQLREGRVTLADRNVASKAWTAFSTLLNNSDLNYANNPLCPKGTEYVRKFKGASRMARTSQLSAIEFLGTLALKGGAANIIMYAKQNLERDNLRGVHQALSGRDGINGIGGKIASFFLRDVAGFYHIGPSKDRYMLQPIDVWIRNMSTQLIGVQKSDKEVARWIVREAARSGINPEAVNQGMWYYGSQVGGSGYRVARALNDLGYAKALLDEHIEALRSALLAWEQMQVTIE